MEICEMKDFIREVCAAVVIIGAIVVFTAWMIALAPV